MSMEYYAQHIIDGLEPHDGEAIARGLEDEIERRGLARPYVIALLDQTGVVARADSHDLSHIMIEWAWRAIALATPVQRARAFLEATTHEPHR